MSKNVIEEATRPGYKWYKDYLVPAFPQIQEDVNGHMEKIRNFSSRKTDILMCTFPKSGTNWIYEIVGMMVKGEAEYSRSYKVVSMLERISDVTNIADLSPDSFRILNTHLPFQDLTRKHVEKDIYSGWFNYENGFASAIDNGTLRSMFTIQYEHLKRNPLPILKDLSDYLGLGLREDTLSAINDKCSFANMPTAGTEANDNAIRDMAIDGSNFVFRKGIIGDWKNWFTVAQNETFDKIIKEEMRDSYLKIVYE